MITEIKKTAQLVFPITVALLLAALVCSAFFFGTPQKSTVSEHFEDDISSLIFHAKIERTELEENKLLTDDLMERIEKILTAFEE